MINNTDTARSFFLSLQFYLLYTPVNIAHMSVRICWWYCDRRFHHWEWNRVSQMDKVVQCFICYSFKEIRNKYINEVLMFTAKKVGMVLTKFQAQRTVKTNSIDPFNKKHQYEVCCTLHSLAASFHRTKCFGLGFLLLSIWMPDIWCRHKGGI